MPKLPNFDNESALKLGQCWPLNKNYLTQFMNRILLQVYGQHCKASLRESLSFSCLVNFILK